jgi:hypothetical protein
MKVRERVLEFESNVGDAKKFALGIAKDAMAHIIGVLTDLYSDPEGAVIREYSTNALDAHIAAGVLRAIEITLPTQLAPFFKVQDFGAGLDAQDIEEIYSQYGASTKRQSNDVVGMLGLGCKSALTYCDQFTVTSIKDGVETQVAISREEDGTGSMTIISEAPTTQPSGTLITVPVKRDNQFKMKAERFFMYWKPGQVLVNGEAPKQIGGMWIEDGKYLMTDDVDGPMVVMGNVAYPMTPPDEVVNRHGGVRRYDDNRGWVYTHLVAFVNIGDVDFVPSREALNWNKTTVAKIEEVKTDAQAKLDASFLAQIANAPTAREAVDLYKAACQSGLSDAARKTAQFKGHEVMTEFKREPKVISLPTEKWQRVEEPNSSNSYLVVNLTGYRRRGRAGGQRSFSSGNLDGVAFWITNFNGAELTAYKREKLSMLCEQRKIPYEGVAICVKALTPTEKFWLEGATIIDFADVEAIKIKRDTVRVTGDGRPKGSYKGRKDGEWRKPIEAGTIDVSKPIIYFRQANSYIVQHNRMVNLLPTDATIICLGANRVDKFLRDFPTAIEADGYVLNKSREWVKGIDNDDLIAYKIQSNGGAKLKVLDASKVDDPELKKWIGHSKRDVTKFTNEWARHRHILPYGENTLPSPKGIDASPLKKYPLVSDLHSFGQGQLKHVYLYVNAVHKDAQQQAAATAAGKEA